MKVTSETQCCLRSAALATTAGYAAPAARSKAAGKQTRAIAARSGGSAAPPPKNSSSSICSRPAAWDAAAPAVDCAVSAAVWGSDHVAHSAACRAQRTGF